MSEDDFETYDEDYEHERGPHGGRPCVVCNQPLPFKTSSAPIPGFDYDLYIPLCPTHYYEMVGLAREAGSRDRYTEALTDIRHLHTIAKPSTLAHVHLPIDMYYEEWLLAEVQARFSKGGAT